MKKNHLLTSLLLLISLSLCLTMNSCKWGSRSSSHEHEIVSAEASLTHFKLDKGLEIKLVASEPLISTPVAATFDPQGRIWVVEMIGYMPDTLGSHENRPSGKIVILSDSDKDGEMDTRQVFMDSLVMPRAIRLYQGGVLVAEPPNLWFVERNGDTAGTRFLVDSTYAEGGNVEHQPNGLLRGLDNWIYNAKSAKRYRRINGSWEIQHTHFRGQWGITQDNQGRLYYNTNTRNLQGDYFPPSLGAWNPDQQGMAGFNENVVPDNRTYPIHPTPGVNRGYQKTVLDSTKKLIHLTAACGPLIYRGGALGPQYEGNAFVAGPAANLVKRDILEQHGIAVQGKQAYEGREFLSSDDERFRPVNLYDGPDGALYILDMYRGVIQHVTYLTNYLKHQIALRNLQGPLNCGRIYKIVPEGFQAKTRDLSQASPAQWVSFLDDPNSWVRETAQHLLIDGHQTDAVPLLQQKLQSDTSLWGKIHAFWTLDGLDALKDEDITSLMGSGNPVLLAQGVTAAAGRLSEKNLSYWLNAAKQDVPESDSLTAPYLGFLASAAARINYRQAEPLLLMLAKKYTENEYVTDAVISGLYGHESDFFKAFTRGRRTEDTYFDRSLSKVIAAGKKRAEAMKKNALKTQFAVGQRLFETHCQVCHGSDGNGIRSLGAPLNGSNWVVGKKKTLISIVLYGLTGPVKIGNKVYQQPEVADEMPGIGQNPQFSNSDIAQILSYIRNAWDNHASPVTAEDILQVRVAEKARQQPFTMDELP